MADGMASLSGKGWPWNGYELLQMKKAGKYPQRIDLSHAI